jgi:hypothetical protein
LISRTKPTLWPASNAYRNALVTFCNWCIATNRLATNPFAAVPKANEKAERRRQRRAMCEEELVRLLEVARERPLLEALTVRKGPREGERYANVRPEVQESLRRLAAGHFRRDATRPIRSNSISLIPKGVCSTICRKLSCE